MYFGLMIIIFVLGYAIIALEHSFRINKSATALVLAAVLWAVYALFSFEAVEAENLVAHLGETAEILFFLLGAMAIVEIIDAYGGFALVTERITTTNARRLLWIIALLTFFFSAVLDNLTTSIVMCALLGRLIGDKEKRWFFAGVVVLSANAGGAWSPIGDVTTIMLWIGGQVSAGSIIAETFIPSLISMLVPLIAITFTMKGDIQRPENFSQSCNSSLPKPQSLLVLTVGVLLLLFVPIFKTITHLPPYLGILLGLGLLWILTEIILRRNPSLRQKLSVTTVIQKVDTPSVLFFLGILMAVQALGEAGHLELLSHTLNSEISNLYAITAIIGVLSAVVDNVPLVAASMSMYPIADAAQIADNPDLAAFAVDGAFWEGLAYCAGTGGSLLIIGSAAGVAVMGMEKIDFLWYLKKITLWAFLGYISGAATFYLLSQFIFHS